MNTKGYANIPDALFEAITFLAHALPKRSAPMWLAIKPKRHWTQKKPTILMECGLSVLCRTVPDTEMGRRHYN